MRFELTRRNRHYPLKVACLPISPSALLLVMVCPEQDSNLHDRKATRTWNERVYQFRHLGNHYINKAVSYRFSPWERKTGLEPATLTLARLCSTNWATSAITGAKVGIFFKYPNLLPVFLPIFSFSSFFFRTKSIPIYFIFLLLFQNISFIIGITCYFSMVFCKSSPFW